MNDYHATDEDLPDIFWPGGEAPHGKETTVVDSRAVKVMLHYPEIHISKRQQQRHDKANRSEREVSLEDRKVYVKLSKKLQMWDWLRGLLEADTIVKVREGRELIFLTELYAKFYRYTPYNVKWITRKQYDWLKWIACQYLKVPNE